MALLNCSLDGIIAVRRYVSMKALGLLGNLISLTERGANPIEVPLSIPV
jgi:hypothetical protein